MEYRPDPDRVLRQLFMYKCKRMHTTWWRQPHTHLHGRGRRRDAQRRQNEARQVSSAAEIHVSNGAQNPLITVNDDCAAVCSCCNCCVALLRYIRRLSNYHLLVHVSTSINEVYWPNAPWLEEQTYHSVRGNARAVHGLSDCNSQRKLDYVTRQTALSIFNYAYLSSV